MTQFSNKTTQFAMDQSVQVLQTCLNHASREIEGNKVLFVEAMFPQLWDTAMLGFLGVAKAEDTLAYTVIIGDYVSKVYKVYFDGRFAYDVHNPNQNFCNAIASRTLGNQLFASEYEITIDPPEVEIPGGSPDDIAVSGSPEPDVDTQG